MRNYTVNPGAAAAAYGNGDVIGSVKTIGGGSGLLNPHVILNGVIVKDTSGQTAQLDIVFFNEAPTGTYTDNAAAAIAAADVARIIGIVSVVTADWKAIGSQSFAPKSDLNIALAGASHVLFISRGTPTYTASSISVLLQCLEVED